MTFDHLVSLASAIISFAGLLLVVLQLRDSTKQRQSQSLVEIYDINRQLLSLGFDHPQLFAILADEKANPVFERRYLQMWTNQFSLIHMYLSQAVFKGELGDSLIRDLADFMAMKNMQKHWKENGSFYSESFQQLVNDLIKQHEPPEKAAHADMNSGD